MSQNRSEADRRSIVDGLKAEGSADATAVAQLINPGPKP